MTPEQRYDRRKAPRFSCAGRLELHRPNGSSHGFFLNRSRTGARIVWPQQHCEPASDQELVLEFPGSGGKPILMLGRVAWKFPRRSGGFICGIRFVERLNLGGLPGDTVKLPWSPLSARVREKCSEGFWKRLLGQFRSWLSA